MEQEDSKYVRIRKFPFIIGIFLLVFLTAGITFVALTLGNEKAQSQSQSIGQSQERAEFAKFYATYDTLTKQYYKNLDKEKVIDGAIKGMIESLDDPYTSYMDPKEAESFHENISSSFEGIGAEVQEKDSHIEIVSPIKGSPAEKAGLRPKDIILSVNGKSLEGLTANQAVLKIRGKKGTKVELMIQRAGAPEPTKVTITRDTIPIQTVYAKMMDNQVARIQVTSFSERTGDELEKSIKEMQDKGMKGMVLDLRQNPGGLLDQAMKIASMFVPKGDIIFQVEDRQGHREVVRSKNNGEPSFPVVVLVDEGSASASEIVAAALKESAHIPLVGVKTFGKGTVQTTQDFKDGSNVKFTMAKWLTPKGNWIHHKGIQPDIIVKLPDYANLTYISPDKALSISSSLPEVKVAEQMLQALGYNPGNVDGYFDKNTENAVKKFQIHEKLKPTGIVEGKTTIAMMTNLREKILNNDVQLEKAVETVKKQISKK